VKDPKSRYEEEEVEGLPAVPTFVMEHLQSFNNILANMERAGATISGEISDWCWQGVQIVEYVWGDAGRWPEGSKGNKVCNCPWCENRTKCRAFLGLCTLYQIWIAEYAIVVGPLFWILQKDVQFQWEAEEKKAMEILKEALYNTPALKTLDICDRAGQIVIGVDASLEGWGVIIQQEDENIDWHPGRYEIGLWNETKKK